MAHDRITHVPIPGSSAQTPTGAMQFEQDWPGLFVRGDDAGFLLRDIRHVERLLRENGKHGLPPLLAEIAEVIERDVIVRGESATGGG